MNAPEVTASPSLYEACREIAVACGYDEVVRHIGRVLVPRFAQLCIIDLDEQHTLVRRGVVADEAAGFAAPASVTAPHPDADEGVAEVLRRGKTLVYGRGWIMSLGRDDETLRAYAGGSLRSVAMLPLVFDNAVLGVLTVGFSAEVTGEAIRPFEVFAQSAAVAIVNARLYDQMREARSATASARTHLSYLSRASGVFTRSFDPDLTMRRFANTMIGEYCDGIAIAMLGEDDAEIERLHAGSVALEAAHALTLQAIRTARPCMKEGAHVLAVPMVSDGRVEGGIAFTRDAARAPFVVDDMTIAEDLASRAAAFLENSRSFGRHRLVSQTLQDAFRPRSLPQIPGLTVAAVYQPGTVDIDIGGDWYDVAALSARDVALVIGDVMGHGIEAASVMAELRFGLRTLLFSGLSPSECLARMDRVLAARNSEIFATALVAILRLDDLTLRIANAGHPVPFVRSADGALTALGAAAPPLGLSGETAVVYEHQMSVGDTYVMFTDGIVEDGSRAYDVGIERLRRIIQKSGPDPRSILDHALTLTPTSSDDRTAIAIRIDRT